MRRKIREADIKSKTRTKAVSDYLRRVMHNKAPPSPSHSTKNS